MELIKKYFWVFFISMIPLIELRGAIPYGVAAGLPVVTAFIVSIIGNILPVPFVIIFIRKIIEIMKKMSKNIRKFAEWLERKAEKNKETVLRYEFWGLMLLVAIPLPGTGAWTGALVAAMLDMQLKRAFPSIAVGVVVAGIVVSLATMGVIAIV